MESGNSSFHSLLNCVMTFMTLLWWRRHATNRFRFNRSTITPLEHNDRFDFQVMSISFEFWFFRPCNLTFIVANEIFRELLSLLPENFVGYAFTYIPNWSCQANAGNNNYADLIKLFQFCFFIVKFFIFSSCLPNYRSTHQNSIIPWELIENPRNGKEKNGKLAVACWHPWCPHPPRRLLLKGNFDQIYFSFSYHLPFPVVILCSRSNCGMEMILFLQIDFPKTYESCLSCPLFSILSQIGGESGKLDHFYFAVPKSQRESFGRLSRGCRGFSSLRSIISKLVFGWGYFGTSVWCEVRRILRWNGIAIAIAAIVKCLIHPPPPSHVVSIQLREVEWIGAMSSWRLFTRSRRWDDGLLTKNPINNSLTTGMMNGGSCGSRRSCVSSWDCLPT